MVQASMKPGMKWTVTPCFNKMQVSIFQQMGVSRFRMNLCICYNGITVLLIHKALLVIFSTTNSDCKEMNLSHYSDTHSLTTLYFFYHCLMNTVTDRTKADQMKIGYEISVQLVQLSMSSSISLFFYRKEDWYTLLRDGINNSIVHCYSSLRFK